MNKAEVKDWDKRTAHLTKDGLLHLALLSEIRYYENDLPDGPILDIGTGLGSEALYFSSKGKIVYAVDKEIYFLNRMAEISQHRIETVKSKMPKGQLPQQKFALVILSNILHFLSLDESITVCKRVADLMKTGSYALLRVHSKKHPYSSVKHKKNGKFNHFFSLREVKSLFPIASFDVIFLSNYRRQFSTDEVRMMGLEQNIINAKDAYTLIVRKK